MTRPKVASVFGAAIHIKNAWLLMQGAYVGKAYEPQGWKENAYVKII